MDEEEPAELEVARGELKGFLDSRAASRAAKTRAETKVSAWEAKLASLVEEEAEEGRIRWPEANLRKAKEKVAEKQAAIEGFDRSVRQSERELAAVVARVKDKEVVEVEVVDEWRDGGGEREGGGGGDQGGGGGAGGEGGRATRSGG